VISPRDLRRKLARAAERSAADWAVVAESWWELLRADVAVSLRPYARWRDRLARAPEPDPAGSAERVDARVVELFRIAASYHVRPMNCLRRAIALRAVLARRGHDAVVRFGVRRDGDRLEAHAWLTVGGAVVDTGDTVRADYVPLDPIQQEAVR